MGTVIPDLLDLRPSPSLEGLDRRNPVADRYRHRVERLPLHPQHQPNALSPPAFPVWHDAAAIRTLAFLHAQGRPRVRLRPSEHPAVSCLARDFACLQQREMDFPMGEHCRARNRLGRQPRRMASEFPSVPDRKCSRRNPGHLRWNRCTSLAVPFSEVVLETSSDAMNAIPQASGRAALLRCHESSKPSGI